jgi:hypothetical protein
MAEGERGTLATFFLFEGEKRFRLINDATQDVWRDRLKKRFQRKLRLEDIQEA